MKRRLRRILAAAGGLLVLLLLVIAVETALGWRCGLEGHLYPPRAPARDQQGMAAAFQNYARAEDDSFLSYPEWYIVWSYEEKAAFQEHHLPSGFPYFAAVRQYWSAYCCIRHLVRGNYPFNAGEHLMLVVIGTSFSAEYILKGAYEKSVGALSEWSSRGQPTEEDQFAAAVMREYADFVHVRPFYEFRFARNVRGLWTKTPLSGAHLLRKWERKIFLTVDYTVEALYCWWIEKLTHLSYGTEPAETFASIVGAKPELIARMPRLKLAKSVGLRSAIVAIPRYQEFTAIAVTLATQGIQFVDIAGNSQVLVSVLAALSWHYPGSDAKELFSAPILTDRSRKRVAMVCQVPALSTFLNTLPARGAVVEHIYDY